VARATATRSNLAIPVRCESLIYAVQPQKMPFRFGLKATRRDRSRGLPPKYTTAEPAVARVPHRGPVRFPPDPGSAAGCPSRSERPRITSLLVPAQALKPTLPPAGRVAAIPDERAARAGEGWHAPSPSVAEARRKP